jgi:GAF domain-containing protein
LFAQVARELASQPDLEQTIRRITELAIQLTGCEIAAVWALSGQGTTVLKGASNEAFGIALDSIITGVNEGVVHDAVAQRTTVYMPDIDVEDRWPYYVAALLDHELPVGSAVAYSLELDDAHLGALALYASAPGYFTEVLLEIGDILADHAAIALESATLADRNHHLSIALRTNRRIGMAVGILMALQQVGEQEAFDLLRVSSQHSHQKLREIAEEVIQTGATPEWRPGRSTRR